MIKRETLKQLLGITGTEKDVVLDFIIADVTETICNYCNLRELPTGLQNTVYRMAMDVYRAEGLGSETAPITVTALKEGDVSYQMQRNTDDAVYASSVLKNYTVQLNRYRRLKKPCKD